MTNNKEKQKQAKKDSDKKDTMEDLKIFIRRKQIQNVALKKIISKINDDEKLNTNK